MHNSFSQKPAQQLFPKICTAALPKNLHNSSPQGLDSSISLLPKQDVLICINAPYMTQRVLKPWWSWTYQNSAVKRAAARAIPGWVTSWEVWYGEPKADSIVSLGVDRYTCKIAAAPAALGHAWQHLDQLLDSTTLHARQHLQNSNNTLQHQQ
jgi:hypothetical protein